MFDSGARLELGVFRCNALFDALGRSNMVGDANDFARAHVNVNFVGKATGEQLAGRYGRRNERVVSDWNADSVDTAILGQFLQIHQVTRA